MGHAYPKNISRHFLQRLYKRRKLSVKECSDWLVANKIQLSCAEGKYEEPYLFRQVLETIVAFLLFEVGDGPVVEPVSLTPDQRRVLRLWKRNDDAIGDWDCGDDGEGGEYGVLDSIQWKFTYGWRARAARNEIPLLDYIES